MRMVRPAWVTAMARRVWRADAGMGRGGRRAGGCRGVSGEGRPKSAEGDGGVVLVESPAKARKLQKWLGEQFSVLATFGHVRDINNANAVDANAQYRMRWTYSDRGTKVVKDIAEALIYDARRRQEGASLVIMTDPDREGEAIAWHVVESLRDRHGDALALAATSADGRELLAMSDDGDGDAPTAAEAAVPVSVTRCVFQEVTERAVVEAMRHPRHISTGLVDAALARRGLDYLFGYGVSPLLWTKMPGCRSAGRVQSVALRLLCEREREVVSFQPQEYYTIAVWAHPADAPDRAVELMVQSCDTVAVDGDTNDDSSTEAADDEVDSSDNDDTRGSKPGRFDVYADAERAVDLVNSSEALVVTNVVRGKRMRSNPPPFTTSTLQQRASAVYGMGASRCMAAAQRLYEGADEDEGLITYMRTDSTSVSARADIELRKSVAALLGPEFEGSGAQPAKVAKAGVQGAHEAIRPTNPRLTPAMINPQRWKEDDIRVYALIWERALASRCAPTELATVRMEVTDQTNSVGLKATASYVVFAGARKLREAPLWPAVAGSTPPDAGAESWWASLEPGDKLVVWNHPDVGANPEVSAHLTSPPRRYNDGSIVKQLESIGVGRPSTYAPILNVLRERGYVDDREALAMDGTGGKVLRPTSIGRVLSEFLVAHFPSYVDFGFTASMERKLDAIAGEEADCEEEGVGGDMVETKDGAQVTGFQVLDEFWRPLDATLKDKQENLSVRGLADEISEVLCPDLVPVLREKLVLNGHAANKDSADRTCPKCGKGRLGFIPSRRGGWFVGCNLWNSETDKCTFITQTRDPESLVLLSHMSNALKSELPAGVKRAPSFVAAERSQEEMSAQLTRLEQESEFPRSFGAPPTEWLVKQSLSLEDYSDAEIWGRRGPYGAYVSVEPREGVDAEKIRANLGRDGAAVELTMEGVLEKLEGVMGRHVGEHTDVGGAIRLYKEGRFGPYVQHRVPSDLIEAGAIADINSSITNLVRSGVDLDEVDGERLQGMLEMTAMRRYNRAAKYAAKQTGANSKEIPDMTYRDTLIWLGQNAELVDASNPRRRAKSSDTKGSPKKAKTKTKTTGEEPAPKTKRGAPKKKAKAEKEAAPKKKRGTPKETSV